MNRRGCLKTLIIAALILCALPYIVPLSGGRGVDPTALADSGQFVTVAGYRTYVQSAGDPASPTVLLLHGFGESTLVWRDTLPALANAGYHAVAIDLKGHGLADKRWYEDYSHVAHADFIAGVLDELNIETAIVVGHSVGGSIASHFYLRHAERVEQLVFVNGGAFELAGEETSRNLVILLQFPPVRRTARHLLRRMFDDGGAQRFWRNAYADRSFFTAERLALRTRYQQTLNWDNAYLALLRDGAANGIPRWFTSDELPINVIWGDQDRWIRPSRGQWYADAINAPFHVIPNAGHLPMEETADAFNDLLITLISK